PARLYRTINKLHKRPLGVTITQRAKSPFRQTRKGDDPTCVRTEAAATSPYPRQAVHPHQRGDSPDTEFPEKSATQHRLSNDTGPGVGSATDRPQVRHTSA